jgi:Flp pilus assembly protein TadD
LNEDGAARLREALAIDPSIVEAWMQLALAQRALGRRDEARDSLLQARALRPGDENILHNLALYFLEASRFAEATALLRDATERNPQSARLWQLFGSALRSNSEPQPAVAAFSRVLELDPTNATGLAQPSAVHLAQLAFDRGDDAVAEREARRALGWDGKDARALDVLGLALQRTGDLEGAATAFAGAVEVDPARAETFNYLGSVRYRQARWSEAQAAFSRAVALRPTLIEAADNLALTQKRLEEVENIRRQLGFAAARFERAGSMKGILAGEVLTTGVAGKAGLQNGDVIVRVEGAPIESPADLNAYLVKVPPPRGLAIEILRANKLSKLKFKFPR